MLWSSSSPAERSGWRAEPRLYNERHVARRHKRCVTEGAPRRTTYDEDSTRGKSPKSRLAIPTDHLRSLPQTASGYSRSRGLTEMSLCRDLRCRPQRSSGAFSASICPGCRSAGRPAEPWLTNEIGVAT